MVIDTSALLAILQGEPERRALIDAIQNAESCLLSTATLVETSIVIEARYGVEGGRDLDLFLKRAGFEFVPVDVEQAEIARRGFNRYGRRRHRAALNFGDCFAYALAISLGESLLFKGDGFRHTDVQPHEA